MREVVRLEQQRLEDSRRFVALRNALDDLLDDRIQTVAVNELQRPTQDADRAAATVASRARMLMPLFALSAGGAGLILIRGTRRPIERLVRGTDAIRRGNLAYRIDARGSDELAGLAREFNRMVEQLESTTVSKVRLEESEARLRSTNAEQVRQIAERQLAEEKQERLRAALHRSRVLAAMGSLVAGVAHEVRNPLFGIGSTVDALEARLARLPSGEGFGQHIRVLRGEVERLNKLMQDLLDYGKPAALERSLVPMPGVADGALAACRRAADAAGVRLELRLGAALPAVQGDPIGLTQVFQNLLDNAIQHSPAGETVALEVTAADEGGSPRLVCQVTDRGPGFTPEDLPHVFEPFFTRRRTVNRGAVHRGARADH